MTFSYTPSSPTDVTRVRFHIADTDSNAAAFTDEEITFVISEAGTWQKAVIQLIQHLIAKLAQTPDATMDWLKVEPSKALATYQALLIEKKRELGVTNLVATAVHTYRADSDLTEAPDWASEALGGSSECL